MVRMCSLYVITSYSIHYTKLYDVAAGNCAGNYVITRTWTATDDCENATSADQVITVQDLVAPVLTIPSDVTIACTDDNTPTGTSYNFV